MTHLQSSAPRFTSHPSPRGPVAFTDHAFVLHLRDGCTLFVPLGCVPGLLEAPWPVRRNCRLLPDGRVAWPELRQSFDVSALLAAGRSRIPAPLVCE